jgi:hypothetical protein
VRKTAKSVSKPKSSKTISKPTPSSKTQRQKRTKDIPRPDKKKKSPPKKQPAHGDYFMEEPGNPTWGDTWRGAGKIYPTKKTGQSAKTKKKIPPKSGNKKRSVK